MSGTRSPGGVQGPASSTSTALARFNGATGQLLQDGTILEDSAGNLLGIASLSAAAPGTTSTLGASGALIGSSSNTGNQVVGTTTNWPATGYLIVDSEIVKYTVTDGTNINVTARGKFGTTGASHSNGAATSFYIFWVGTSDAVAPFLCITSGGLLGYRFAVPVHNFDGGTASNNFRNNGITSTSINATQYQKNGATTYFFGFDASSNPKLVAANVDVLTAKSDRVTHHGTFTPASAAATGAAGDIAWDASFIYVCTAANTWKRVAIATW